MIKPHTSLKLLGVTLDQHLTFGPHIDNISKKCHGILGAIARAAPFLTIELRKLAFAALVRSHLEYCSAVFASASLTQLRKLDTIQKMGSRIITGAHRSAHSAPLIQALQLDSLEVRRSQHICSLVDSILVGSHHPLLNEMFQVLEDGSITSSQIPRIGIGKKRFSFFASEVFNRQMLE